MLAVVTIYRGDLTSPDAAPSRPGRLSLDLVRGYWLVSTDRRETMRVLLMENHDALDPAAGKDTLDETDLTWGPATIIRGRDLAEHVSALRAKDGGDIYIYGSLTVVRSLLTAGLVDELLLFIEPITLGGGKTLFPNDGEARRFELVSAETTGTGVQVCRYRPTAAN